MASKTKKLKTVDKWRKKKYYNILAPKLLQERELGQSMAYEPSELKGRCIKTNLMMLTGNIKKQDINITFRVDKVQGDTGFTFFEKYEISPAAIKRKVRRMRNRVDGSFKCVTKDNKLLRIKPMLITGFKVSKAVAAELQKELVRFTIATVRKLDYDTVILDIVNDKLQKDTANKLKKITPVRFVDIRTMICLGDYKGPALEIPEEPEKTAKKEDIDESEDEKKE